MKTEDLLREIESLPVDERAKIADLVLKGLNAPNLDIDEQWAGVAKRRLDEIQSGSVKPVSGEEVFAEISKRFS